MPTLTDRNRLIEENLPLVGYLAADVHRRATHIPREELASVGALALVTAADAFDPSLGVPFGAYARRRILGAFADEMRAMDWATRGIRKRIKETVAVRDALTAGLGRRPTVSQMAATMGVTEETAAEALADADRSVTSLEDPSVAEVPWDQMLPEESAEVRERRRVLESAMASLPERMRRIVQAVYFEERAVKDVAEELGVSHSAVSQQRSEAVRLLRDALELYFGEDTAPVPTSRVSPTARESFFARVGEELGPRRTALLPGRVVSAV